MSRNTSRNRAQRSTQSRPRTSRNNPARRRFIWPVIALVLVTAGLAIIWFANREPRVERKSQAAVRAATDQDALNHAPTLSVEPATADTAWDSSWPPLPQSGPPARPIEQVRAAYAYAARRGDVLQYIPCYCGCERQGHGSNKDCFVDGKTATGVPRWDPMGYT